jgi:Initiator Rep protein, WH2/Initiator Replication protein, WH1
MVKPGELIDFVEMSPLSLIDRRTYNLLLAHAWDRIDQPVAHVIAKSELLGWSNHESTDIIGESVERLMAAIIRTQIEIDGKPYIQRTQLLASTTEARAPDGLLYYRFSDEMRAIIRDSGIFARLHTDVILALSSRYSLALYELCRKRVNLNRTWSEEFTVDRFRELLGVEPGVLLAFKDFNKRAIRPAVAEVNGLSEVGCKAEPVLAGRKVVKIRLSWWRKNEDELKDAYRELQASKVGRMARLKGTVEQVTPPPGEFAELIANVEPASIREQVRDFAVQLFERLLQNIDGNRAAYVLPDGAHTVVFEPMPGATPTPDTKAVLHTILDQIRREGASNAAPVTG